MKLRSLEKASFSLILLLILFGALVFAAPKESQSSSYGPAKVEGAQEATLVKGASLSGQSLNASYDKRAAYSDSSDDSASLLAGTVLLLAGVIVLGIGTLFYDRILGAKRKRSLASMKDIGANVRRIMHG